MAENIKFFRTAIMAENIKFFALALLSNLKDVSWQDRNSLKHPLLSVTLTNHQWRTLEFGKLGIYSKK